MPLSIYEKLGIESLKPTRMTLELANRSVALLKGIAQDVIVRVDKCNFLDDFVVVDFEDDPRVPIILGRPFLHTAKALVDLYEEKLMLRVENEEVVFYTDKSSRNNSRDIKSVHCINVIDFSKDNPTSGSTTFPSDSLPGAHFLVLHLLGLVILLSRSSPMNSLFLNHFHQEMRTPKTDIDIIDPILERFTDEPALVYSFLPGDDDDDLFDFKSDNEEWKKLLYDNPFNNTHSKNEKDKDLKIECLIDDMDDYFFPILPTSRSTLLKESSEIATLLSSPFRNEDKVFNPGILILGGTHIFHD
ncbi:reverse transcriptase domain-containing protein [Tanacetum coccineum]